MTIKGADAQEAAKEPTLVLYGRDNSGKPHASWFGPADTELAAKAASLMGMVALPVTSAECRAIALQASPGRIFASGLALAPFCKTSVYGALKALGGEPPKPVPKPVVADDDQVAPLSHSSVPTTWPEIEVGSLVLSPEGEGAWYASVVSEAKDDDLLVLRWKDWPDEPAFVRRRDHVALVRSIGDEAA